jgi:hypothetical protein
MVERRCGRHLTLRALVLTIVAFTAYSCDEPLVGPSTSEITFRGRVTDYVLGSPIAAATVEFVPAPATITDSNGEYGLTVRGSGRYTVRVNGTSAGSTYVNGTPFRGDLLIATGTCISRYGLIIDDRSLRPIRGATVMLQGKSAATATDGWYRIDLGCPDILLPGNTTVISVTHPDYETGRQPVGRGVFRVERLDLALRRR